MSESTQEMWTEEFQQMAKGHRSYHHQFYQLSHKSSDEQTGGGSNKIRLIQPTPQQVAQAKFQIRHDLEEEEEPSKKKGKKRKVNDFML